MHTPKPETKKQICWSCLFPFPFITPTRWSTWRMCTLQRVLTLVLVCSLAIISWKVHPPLNALKIDLDLSEKNIFFFLLLQEKKSENERCKWLIWRSSWFSTKQSVAYTLTLLSSHFLTPTQSRHYHRNIWVFSTNLRTELCSDIKK